MQKVNNLQIFKNVTKFWDSYFHGCDEITIDQCLIAFFYYIKDNAEFELTPQQLINIRNLVDEHYRGMVNIRQFCLFYEQYWNVPTERRKIMNGTIEVTIKHNMDPVYYKALILKAEKVPKGALIKVGDEVRIQELEPKDFPTELYIDKSVGKEGTDLPIVKPEDPFFHRELFRITRSMEGFKMKCVSSNQRLMYKVEQKPFFLYEGMVFQVGLNNRFRVVYAYPKPLKGKYKDYVALRDFHKEDFIHFTKSRLYNTIDAIKDEFERYLDGILAEQKDNKMAVKLECIAGPMKGETIDIEHKITSTPLHFSFGRVKDENEIFVNEMTVSNHHCKIKFDMSGWYLVEEQETKFGTYVLFPTYNQLAKGKFSYSLKVETGMKVRFDDFIFSLKVKNLVREGAEELHRRLEERGENLSTVRSDQSTQRKTDY